MELIGGGGGKSRVSSPERSTRMGFQERERMRALSWKVQIVYYLSRNGQLEHPHFMELSLPPNQQLRLKDVMEKLSVLRGIGMPSLFSWSCKRRYKNGYVWNDLSGNDVIYPADGAEYVLKGSEIISGCTDGFEPFQLGNRHPKPLIPTNRQHHIVTGQKEIGIREPNNPHCSLRVSKEDVILLHKSNKLAQTEMSVEDGSPALSTSSSDPVAAESAAAVTRNSVLLQLISCGSSVGPAKGGRKSGKGDEENSTRSGCLRRIEDKEYFSGSIVEVIRKPADSVEPKLKKSSSFNEQRSSKLGLGEESLDSEINEAKEGMRVKCIPGRKGSSFKK